MPRRLRSRFSRITLAERALIYVKRLRLIAGTVKIPLIESDAFRPGDKACRNAAQTADFTSRHITAEVESFLVNIERRVRRAPHDGSQFALDPIKAIEQRPPQRSLAKDRDQPAAHRCGSGARSNASVVRIKNTLPVQKTSKLD
jgi:hypothetical protein